MGPLVVGQKRFVDSNEKGQTKKKEKKWELLWRSTFRRIKTSHQKKLILNVANHIFVFLRGNIVAVFENQFVHCNLDHRL